jgi:hypothetical protein
MIECNRQTGQTVVCFQNSQKYWFREPELHQIAMAVVLQGESLCGVFDWLLEWCNSTDYQWRDDLRFYVEEAIRVWLGEELPL